MPNFFFLRYRMVTIVADEFLTDARDRKYYADHYTCCPPPLFIIIITLVEVSCPESMKNLCVCACVCVCVRIWCGRNGH